MRYILYCLVVLVLSACSLVVAGDEDNKDELEVKRVVAKGDDFAAIMLRSQSTSAFAFTAANKADKAVGKKIDGAVKKIDNLESKVENLTKTNEELKANITVIEPYIIEPLVDSTVSKEDNR